MERTTLIMDSGLHTIPLFPLARKHKVAVILLFVSQIILASLLCLGHLNLFLLFIGSLVFLLAVTDFELSVYLLIVSFFIEYFFFPGWGIKLADFAILAVVLAYLGRQVLSGHLFVKRTPLDRSIFIFMLVLTISLVNIVDVFVGMRNYLRHIQMFILFYVLVSGIKKESILKYLKFFLILATLHSLQTLYLFITSHGERSFGIAGVPFANIVVIALTIGYILYLFEKQLNRRLCYAFAFVVLLGALIAIQTRSALIPFLFGYLLIGFLALRKSRAKNMYFVRHNLLLLTVLVVILSGIAVLVDPSMFSEFVHRVHLLFSGPVGTIKARFVLWEIAWRAFVRSPILGIGLGQFIRIWEVLPSVRFVPLFENVYGLSAHSSFFSYLAETGLVGILSFLFIIFSFLKICWLTYKNALAENDVIISLCIIGGIIVGQWNFWSVNGMIFMFFLALLVVLSETLAVKAKYGEAKPT